MEPSVLQGVEAALVEHYGSQPQRASVSFLGVEPIEILRFEPIPDERAYVSLGMSRRPMTEPDATLLTTDGPRAELALHLRDPQDRLAGVWRRLAVLAAAPAVEGVVYRAGMTVDLGEPMVEGAAVTGALLTDSAIPPVVTGSATESTEVAILEVVPATSAELAWCRVRGAAELQARWADQRVDLLDLLRRSVRLD